MHILKEDFIYPSQLGITFMPHIEEKPFVDYLRKYFAKDIGTYTRDNIELRLVEEDAASETLFADFVITYVDRGGEGATEFTFHIEIMYPDEIMTSLYENDGVLIGDQRGTLKDLDLRIKTAAESVRNALLIDED